MCGRKIPQRLSLISATNPLTVEARKAKKKCGGWKGKGENRNFFPPSLWKKSKKNENFSGEEMRRKSPKIVRKKNSRIWSWVFFLLARVKNLLLS